MSVVCNQYYFAANLKYVAVNQNVKYANRNLLAEFVEKLNLPLHLRLLHLNLKPLQKNQLMRKLLLIHHLPKMLLQKIQNLPLIRLKLRLLMRLQHHQKLYLNRHLVKGNAYALQYEHRN